MSGWTGTDIVRENKRVVDERVRQRDKEELVQEIVELKKMNNIYVEEMRLLKTEINKIRNKTSTGFMKQKESVVVVNDVEKLKEQLMGVKKELTEVREENKVLKAKNEQYKKRAVYAKNKVLEVNNKKESIVKEAVANNES